MVPDVTVRRLLWGDMLGIWDYDDALRRHNNYRLACSLPLEVEHGSLGRHVLNNATIKMKYHVLALCPRLRVPLDTEGSKKMWWLHTERARPPVTPPPGRINSGSIPCDDLWANTPTGEGKE